MITAIYLRVSTQDQDIDSQRQRLTDYCSHRKFEDSKEFVDHVSGGKFTRTGLDEMIKEARKGRVKRIVCFKIDRLGRSLNHLVNTLTEFHSLNVGIICPEQGVDTSDSNPAGRLSMHILCAVAEFERELIRDRTLAGLEAAKKRGVKLGRKPLKYTELQMGLAKSYLIKEELGRPVSIRDLAKQTGLTLATAHRLVRSLSKPG